MRARNAQVRGNWGAREGSEQGMDWPTKATPGNLPCRVSLSPLGEELSVTLWRKEAGKKDLIIHSGQRKLER